MCPGLSPTSTILIDLADPTSAFYQSADSIHYSDFQSQRGSTSPASIMDSFKRQPMFEALHCLENHSGGSFSPNCGSTPSIPRR